MNSSLIVWEDTSNIPFPDEIKKLVEGIKWSDIPWQVMGLPTPMAKYTLSGGKTLYLEELPTGKVDIQKLDFTGEIWVANYFINQVEPDGYNYFLQLRVVLIKGEVSEVSVLRVEKELAKVYREQQAEIEANIMKNIKRSRSWWYRFIYLPWFYLVRIPAYLIILALSFLRWLVNYIALKLTPI